VAYRNARLTVHGRRLLVHRVRELGMPVAHVARAMGISRQCAHRPRRRSGQPALGDLLDYYDHRRRHTALSGQPTDQPTVTNLKAEYTPSPCSHHSSASVGADTAEVDVGSYGPSSSMRCRSRGNRPDGSAPRSAHGSVGVGSPIGAG
jgi:hypothetical protein